MDWGLSQYGLGTEPIHAKSVLHACYFTLCTYQIQPDNDIIYLLNDAEDPEKESHMTSDQPDALHLLHVLSNQCNDHCGVALVDLASTNHQCEV